MFIDSHCHLQTSFKAEEINAYLDTIHTQINFLIDLSTNFDEILKQKNLNLPKWVFKSFGLLPEFSPNGSNLFSKIRETVEQYQPDAIGEIGMDYHWNEGTPLEQEKLVRYQLELSIEKKLPVIIHSREAFEDTFRILKSYSFKSPVILHCFGYGPKEAEDFLDLGFLISFAGNVTFKKALRLQEAAKAVPLNRLLLETDSPYLTPVPLRGKPNQPDFVEHTYRFISRLREIALPELETEIEKNFRSIFPETFSQGNLKPLPC